MKTRAPSRRIRTEMVVTTGTASIVVPIDFSEQSILALKRANAIALERGAAISPVFVLEQPHFAADLANIPVMLSDEAVTKAAREKLTAVTQAEVDATVSIYPKVRTGKPYIEICAVAAGLKAELIVMSSHGYTGLKHALLGSVAEKVVQHAPCDVLILKNRPNTANP